MYLEFTDGTATVVSQGFDYAIYLSKRKLEKRLREGAVTISGTFKKTLKSLRYISKEAFDRANNAALEQGADSTFLQMTEQPDGSVRKTLTVNGEEQELPNG
jgi:hypothetical protein